MKYDELSLIPSVVAQTVCERRSVPGDIMVRFVLYADRRCRAAFETGAKWFLSCARSETSAGRDRLYMFINHWLDAFLADEAKTMRRVTA